MEWIYVVEACYGTFGTENEACRTYDSFTETLKGHVTLSLEKNRLHCRVFNDAALISNLFICINEEHFKMITIE